MFYAAQRWPSPLMPRPSGSGARRTAGRRGRGCRAAARDAGRGAAAAGGVEREAGRTAAQARGVSRTNYDRVQDGMTLGAQVQDILGPGKEVSRAGDLVVMTWQGGLLSGKVISITFENGVVTAKSILD